tara:strand:+ start:156 stop:374 length:219 start_codon:yes stop_codon:yes gene_type:complete
MKIIPNEINDNLLMKENLIEYFVIMIFWISCEKILDILLELVNKNNKLIIYLTLLIIAVVILVLKYHFELLI